MASSSVTVIRLLIAVRALLAPCAYGAHHQHAKQFHPELFNLFPAGLKPEVRW